MNFGSSWNFVNGMYSNTPISNQKSIIEINTDSPKRAENQVIIECIKSK